MSINVGLGGTELLLGPDSKRILPSQEKDDKGRGPKDVPFYFCPLLSAFRASPVACSIVSRMAYGSNQSCRATIVPSLQSARRRS